MNNVAFVTYNTLGDGDLSSGWHTESDRRAFVLQNTKGGRAVEKGPAGKSLRESEIELLWKELELELQSLDHVVIYLGANGSQRAIELCSGLDPRKLVFVTCDCGVPAKTAMVQERGLSGAGKIPCECGGQDTMKELFEAFMAGWLDGRLNQT